MTLQELIIDSLRSGSRRVYLSWTILLKAVNFKVPWELMRRHEVIVLLLKGKVPLIHVVHEQH